MQRSIKENQMGPVTEMAIVDTFTKLIFGDEGYSERESLIIDAFQSMNPDVRRDSYQEIGEYLRNLGVREMIQLVSRLRQHVAENTEASVSIRNQTKSGVSTRPSGHNRGTH